MNRAIMNPNYLIAFIFTGVLMSIISCQSAFEKEIESWRLERINELKTPFSWPSTVGLYHVRNSMAYFGGREGNDFMVPGNAPSFGRIMDYDTAFYMIAHKSLRVQLDGESVGKVRMLTDQEEGGPSVASWRNYQWYLIERGPKTFLRMQDSLSSYRLNLTSIPYFPIREKWKIDATFTPADTTDRIEYENILDMKFNEAFAGYLSFQLKGKDYRLKVKEDGASYFVIFSDETTGLTTYGGGRYIYVDKANKDGKTFIDFNKAINPPCVFTPYATCPLPAKENHIDIEIVAGEKMMKLY